MVDFGEPHNGWLIREAKSMVVAELMGLDRVKCCKRNRICSGTTKEDVRGYALLKKVYHWDGLLCFITWHHLLFLVYEFSVCRLNVTTLPPDFKARFMFLIPCFPCHYGQYPL